MNRLFVYSKRRSCWPQYILRNRFSHLSEADIKITKVLPLLKKKGWEHENSETGTVKSEVPCNPVRGKGSLVCDYVCFDGPFQNQDSKKVMAVEVKSEARFRTELQKQTALDQAVAYSIRQRIPIAIATDGTQVCKVSSFLFYP